MSKAQKAILALIISNIIWGITAPLMKWTLEDVPLGTLAFLRMAIPSIILYFLYHGQLRIKSKDFFMLTTATLLNTTINLYFFFLAMKQTASINAPIIGSSGPLFLMITAIFLLKEHPTKRIVIGNIMGFIGILIIVSEPLLHNQPFDTSFLGNIYLIIATIASVLGTILMKKLMQKNNAPAITFWMFVIGAVSFIPSFISEVSTEGFLPHIHLQGILGLLFGIIFASTLAYYLYNWSLKYATASNASLFLYIDPLAAILVAIPLLHEYPSAFFLLGSTLIFSGIFTAENRLHYHPLRKLLKL